VKGKATAAKEWVKGKVAAGKAWVKGKAKVAAANRSPAERKQALEAAMNAAHGVVTDPVLSLRRIQKKLPFLRNEYKVKRLELVVDEQKDDKDVVHVEGANSPPVAGPRIERPRLSIQRETGDKDSPASAQPDTTPFSTKGQSTEVSAYSETEIQQLVTKARAEAVQADALGLKLSFSHAEKGQFSRAGKLAPSTEDGSEPEKTVAHGGGISAMSGWGIKSDFSAKKTQTVPSTEHEAMLANIAAGQKAGTFAGIPYKTLAEVGAELASGKKPSLSPRTGGVEGQYEASHAERQVYERSGGLVQAIGVTRAPCDTCVDFFMTQAKSTKKIIVIADPASVNVFLPNGKVEKR